MDQCQERRAALTFPEQLLTYEQQRALPYPEPSVTPLAVPPSSTGHAGQDEQDQGDEGKPQQSLDDEPEDRQDHPHEQESNDDSHARSIG